MFDKAVTRDLLWDSALVQSVDRSQQWILSAMRKYGPELITMLWRILGNEQDVCDAYQTTFLNLAHYELRQKPDNVKAYLFRTASNTAISMLRHKITERKIFSNTGSVNAGEARDHFDANHLAESLRYYIAQLPEQLRNVVTLRDLAELPYDQVGRMLSISSATARVYRCKAIQLLAVWMNRERDDAR
jgi:RNA polymerase sigma factor (sigma-70 family)